MQYLKTQFTALFLTLLFMQSTFAQTYDAQTVFMLSPYVENDAAAKAQRKTLIGMLTRLKPGSNALLLDGEQSAPLCTFTIPDDKRYAHPKALLKHNRACIAALTRFYTPIGNGTDHALRRMDIPSSLNFIADNLSLDNVDVIMVGSPFYNQNGELEMNMFLNGIPSDGFINAHPSSSVFGTQSKESALKGLRIHFAYTGSQYVYNAQYRHYLKRFWTLFVEAQGAKMVSFHDNAENVFARVLRGANPIKHDYVRAPSAKREMFKIPLNKPSTPIYERRLSTQELPQQTVTNAENVEVAVRWDCKSCDLDLYAQPWEGAKTLYFGKTTSEQGSFLKDFTASPNASNAWETIIFTVPLDLSKLTIAVNFYGGNAPEGIQGELRLSVAGQVYARPFSLTATQGNGGVDISQQLNKPNSQSPHTLTLSALDIVNQTTTGKVL
jgi:hypothetical protein